MRSMKSHEVRLKFIILPMLIAACLIDCALRGFPTLPSYKDSILEITNAGKFIIENFYAILYFCFSLIFGVTAIAFGIRIGKHNRDEQILFKMSIFFGTFILLSGIWILTDSKLLLLFSDYIRIHAVIFISFLSFMLLPIFFMECLQQMRYKKFFALLENLFFLNTMIFIALIFLQTKSEVYLISLSCHHLLILIASLYFIVSYLKSVFSRKDKFISRNAISVILFFLLIIFSLTAFLMKYTTLYAVTISVALMLMNLTVVKVIIDKTLMLSREKIKADFYKKMAYTDTMSGIYNRNAFNTDIHAVSGSDALCFVIFDINDLKAINDKNGHEAGDEVICASAGLIKECFSPLGKCYRIGGDEFSVICEGKSESELEAALKTFDEKIRKCNLDRKIKLSVAYGYAFRKSQSTTPDELYQQADQNMYRCKNKNARI